jgi:hypothetical protein
MKIYIFISFFFLSVNVIADELPGVPVPDEYLDDTLRVNSETGEIKNLMYKTIEDVQNSNLFGYQGGATMKDMRRKNKIGSPITILWVYYLAEQY